MNTGVRTSIISLKTKDRIVLDNIILDNINIGETVNFSHLRNNNDEEDYINIIGTVRKIEHFVETNWNSNNYEHKCIIYVY